MRIRFAIVALCLAQCSPSSKNAAKELIVKTGLVEKKLTLPELKKRFGAETVKVEDYYLKRPMRYNALNLKKMLTAFAAEAPGYDEFIFRCADGYLAHVSRADFEAGKLDSFHLAFGEGGDSFKSEIPQGKALISPEPFYAVATDKAGFSTLSWPYELIAIELVNFKGMFPKLYLAGLENDKIAKAGFDLFRKECLKCHSLNLQGGDIGPELNIPKNITEYRDEAYLKSFISNASSYRAKSKMPAFAGLTDQDISSIIVYLKRMAGHKQAGLQATQPP
ncbi:MAG: c-type cytochrome [Turneriella sp.]|nr:c-type cytochrome [Turneriella sp.]